MKKIWWPPWAYETRPWAALALAALGGAGALVVSIYQGSWGIPAMLVFGMASALAIYGGIVLQLRREYRESSKWVRHPPPDKPDNP